MKKHIVITTINSPSEAVIKFSKLIDFKLTVVGDYKTPKDWNLDNVNFISFEQQQKLKYKIAKLLPKNHYSRKMIGYLEAIKQGAEFIVDTDDDNIPKQDWGFPDTIGEFEDVGENRGFINIYQLFTDQKIWPRGLPLKLIGEKFFDNKQLTSVSSQIGVWQGLADEDPDVDAIYRLTSDEPCYFNDRKPVTLSTNTICPFNTQNTQIIKELFPLLYLPCHVTFRFTDILKSLIAQPIMWKLGYKLGFTDATVIQKRNPHDYMKDFISEIPMYEKSEYIISMVDSVISPEKSIFENLRLSYEKLIDESIVPSKELDILDAWIGDLKKLG